MRALDVVVAEAVEPVVVLTPVSEKCREKLDRAADGRGIKLPDGAHLLLRKDAGDVADALRVGGVVVVGDEDRTDLEVLNLYDRRPPVRVFRALTWRGACWVDQNVNWDAVQRGYTRWSVALRAADQIEARLKQDGLNLECAKCASPREHCRCPEPPDRE